MNHASNDQPIDASSGPGGSMAAWLSVIGPGAIVASLTIGAGELVFSSRGGAVFGYPLLGFFVLICVLKWALVLLTARQMVLTGLHPLESWAELPGPRGWLIWVFLLLGVIAFPIWVGFHAGTLGTLMASLTGTRDALDGASHYGWGILMLGFVMVLVRTGGYQRLESIQMLIVLVMLICVSVSLVMLQPDWMAMLRGLVTPWKIGYPEWVTRYRHFDGRPLWVELAAYVGVLGGSGYDYLAYVSFLREKRWGAAGREVPDRAMLEDMARNEHHLYRQWLKAPLVDATVSFLVVFFFSAVFVACGATVLGPREQMPDGNDLLTLQAQFVSAGTGWLKSLYFVGAFLAMFGTLYGTIEVAPTVAREMIRALRGPAPRTWRVHAWVTTWVGFGGAMVLGASIAWTQIRSSGSPPALISLLDPANLFTGVLACGLISGLAVWFDRAELPRALQSPLWLRAINLAGCPIFLMLGLKAYWEHSRAWALLLLLSTITSGWIAAVYFNGRRSSGR